jgi:ribosomal protein S18 acetylase RimI-like enzyme
LPSTILTGIRAYATALLSYRLKSTPSLTFPPASISTSTSDIQIVTGYRFALISSTIKLQLSYYGPNNGFGLEFESILAKAMSDLVLRLDGEKNEVWCAVQENEIVGCVWIDGERFNQDTNADGSEPSVKKANLRFFIVSPALHGKGIGRQLISRAVAFCDEKGFEECELSTFKGLDAARKLYQRAGFRDVGEKRYKPWGTEILQQYMVRKRGGVYIAGERPNVSLKGMGIQS